MMKISKNAVVRLGIDCGAALGAVASFAVAVTLLASGPEAIAADQSSASGNCAAMREKVLAAEAHQAGDPMRLREAKYFANEAKSLCETEQQAQGLEKYRQALGVLEGSAVDSNRTQSPGAT